MNKMEAIEYIVNSDNYADGKIDAIKYVLKTDYDTYFINQLGKEMESGCYEDDQDECTECCSEAGYCDNYERKYY